MRDVTLLQISARCIADRVRRREIAAVEVVDAHIRRIEEVNPRINALVADRFAAARREAQAVDAMPAAAVAALSLPGVPFTVKEMIAAEGMPLTFGCRNRADRRATADATVVARLRAAGAILLGVTNVPEWGMWYETYNDVYGRTSNPYDVRRTAGGSSGGEAALVGAGGAAFGVGADIGGSIPMPAAFCGVYGHKPSAGLLPLTGQHPVYADVPDDELLKTSPYLVTGPLARTAGDLALLVRIMAGPDGIDPNAEPLPLHDAARVDWRGRRVLLLPAPRIRLAGAASPVLRAAVLAAGRTLEARGAVVDEVPADLFRRAGDIWFAALQSVGGPSFAELVGGGTRIRVVRELAARLAGRSQYSWTALFFLLGEALGRRGARGMRSAQAEARRVAAEFERLVGDDGVLIMPVHPRPAPRHNAPVLRPFDFLYTAIFNALRMPATSVPAGFDERGLPLAVQIAAARGRDHLTLAAALALEETLGPWLPATVHGTAGSAA
jgi:fatty acid amide hydrolase 2